MAGCGANKKNRGKKALEKKNKRKENNIYRTHLLSYSNTFLQLFWRKKKEGGGGQHREGGREKKRGGKRQFAHIWPTLFSQSHCPVMQRAKGGKEEREEF